MMTMAPVATDPMIAYVDASAILAPVFREEDWEITARQIAGFQMVVSSNLLEAEIRAACAREGLSFDSSSISGIGWVHPNRSLGPEMARALSAGGYSKAGDLWHIAVALYLDARVVGKLAFITRDERQGKVAANLGFET